MGDRWIRLTGSTHGLGIELDLVLVPPPCTLVPLTKAQHSLTIPTAVPPLAFCVSPTELKWTECLALCAVVGVVCSEQCALASQCVVMDDWGMGTPNQRSQVSLLKHTGHLVLYLTKSSQPLVASGLDPPQFSVIKHLSVYFPSLALCTMW